MAWMADEVQKEEKSKVHTIIDLLNPFFTAKNKEENKQNHFKQLVQELAVKVTKEINNYTHICSKVQTTRDIIERLLILGKGENVILLNKNNEYPIILLNTKTQDAEGKNRYEPTPVSVASINWITPDNKFISNKTIINAKNNDMVRYIGNIESILGWPADRAVNELLNIKKPSEEWINATSTIVEALIKVYNTPTT